MTSTDQIPARIFLECTRTWQSSLHTGIERVVRNIVAASEKASRSLGVECQPVVYLPRHGFIPLRSLARKEQQSMAKRSQTLLKRRLEQWGLIQIARTSRQKLQSFSFGVQSLAQPFSQSRLLFRTNDVLLLLDSSWGTPYWNEVRRAKQTGAAVGAMIYDLLPIQTPDSFTKHQLNSFQGWWNQAYHQASFITSISRSVFQECLEYHQRRKSRETQLKGGAFRLGADFLCPQSDLPIRAELLSFANGNTQPVFLCVGTFSPRKQQTLVLDAFDQLWQSGSKASLFYIGGRGWNSESFIRRMRSHVEFGKSLFWRDDLNDAELAHCYRQAAGLITASRGEGFNLPIVEALQQGCSVFASDIPVHREVGGNDATYFPQGNAAALAQILKSRGPTVLTSRKPVQSFQWPNWQESCTELLELILRLAREHQTRDSRPESTAA